MLNLLLHVSRVISSNYQSILLYFDRFDDTGFKVNGVKYEGSLLCVGNLLMSWTPQKFSDITTER